MPRAITTGIVLLLLATGAVWAQAGPVHNQAWQPVGLPRLDLDLAGPAGGAVVDVAFSADGERMFAVTGRGEVWVTPDLGETWARSEIHPDAVRQFARGETAVRQHPYQSAYLFALGEDLHRSTDEGRTWVNLTADRAGSVIGGGQRAIAFSPQDSNLIVVANSRGLWRSVDAGLTWSDLNRNFPNLPKARFLPSQWLPETGEARVLFEGVGPVEWTAAGAWRPVEDSRVASWLRAQAALPPEDRDRRSPWPLDVPSGWVFSYRVWRNGQAVSPDLTACGTSPCAEPERHYVSAFAGGGESQSNFYVGTSDGHLWVSTDDGRTWRAAVQGLAANTGPVTGVFADPRNSRVAVAVVGGQGAGHVFRTTNAGLFWDDLSANLPDVPVNAVAVNSETGSIYVASNGGVFYTRADLHNPGPATGWTRLGGNLPAASIEDLRWNPMTGALSVVVAGHGIFRTSVPDIADALRVLHAADLSARAAAPGGLLTVVGALVHAARAGTLAAPVLSSAQSESQIQVPFESSGDRLELALETQRGPARVGIPLEAVSPGIFVDADGGPLVLDAGSGALVDGARPARAGSQILVLTTGLGRVRPDWPTGLAAPLENPPSTAAPVTAYLNGAPLRVLSSTLAGGYIGVYMVQVELPTVVNSGTAELVIVSGDKFSNKVRIFLAP